MGELEQFERNFGESQVAQIEKAGFLFSLLGNQPTRNLHAVHISHSIRGNRRLAYVLILGGKVLLNRWGCQRRKA